MINKKIILIAFFIFAWSANALSAIEMRRCMLLPIRDSVDGAMAFKIYEEVEYYLKESSWCYYRSNSAILDLLSNYKKSMDAYLENKEVLKILAEKTETGTLIKVKVTNRIKVWK